MSEPVHPDMRAALTEYVLEVRRHLQDRCKYYTPLQGSHTLDDLLAEKRVAKIHATSAKSGDEAQIFIIDGVAVMCVTKVTTCVFGAVTSRGFKITYLDRDYIRQSDLEKILREYQYPSDIISLLNS